MSRPAGHGRGRPEPAQRPAPAGRARCQVRAGGRGAPGSKGVELAAVGALVVVLQGSVGLVDQVVTTVRAWLRRSPSPERTLKLTLNGQTLELSAATEAQQQQLVEEFVRSAARA